MFYFNYFPTMLYDANGDGTAKLVTNIFKRVQLRANMKKELVLLDQYDIQEGETPEIVADKHHGSPHYHWVVMMVNNITDPFHHWPKTEREMQLYMEDKYGSADNQFATHHYEITQTSGDNTITIEVENTSYPSASAISNYTYEYNLNESKRSIDLLRNEYLGIFVDEFEGLLY